jgi:DNA mismatch repair protein MutS2
LETGDILASWDLIGEAVRVLLSQGAPPLSGHRDLSGLSQALSAEGAPIPVEGLLLVSEEAACVEAVKAFAKNLGTVAPLLSEGLAGLGDYREFLEAMGRSISPDCEILDTASTELGRLRREQALARDALVDKLRALMRSADYAPLVRDDIVTTRGDRYVIQVRASGSGKGLVHDWSKTGATAYLEPMEAVDDNNRLNFLRAQERREVERIILWLSSMCRERIRDLGRDGDALTTLDRVCACARMAVDRACSRPEHGPGKGYRLIGLRHPLLEERLRGENRGITPLDFLIEPEKPMLVISGLNTGGKTIALKTLGLNCLIAKSGLFVHAKEGSRMDLPGELLAVMGDNQDLASDLSTFSGHVRALKAVLGKASAGTLILLDELGNGTDPQEGAALALAVLGHLLTTGATVVTATHFHLVKAWALLTEGVVPVAVNSSEDGLPAYGLSYGTPGFSGGLNMAQRLGLPAFLVDAARGFLDEGHRRADELLESLDRELSRLAREREGLELERRGLRDELSRQRDLQLKESERRDREARARDQDIKMALNRYRREWDGLKSELRAALKDGNPPNPVALGARKAELDRDLERVRPETLGTRTESPQPLDPKAGDRVFIRKLGRVGTVVTWNPDKNEGVVESRNVRVKAELAELAEANGKDPEPRVLNIIATPGSTDPSALKLLGFTVDEALLEIDREIDRAILGGRDKLTIIHGLGTGRLKSGISSYLKRHPRVRGFGSPTDIPGGSGVTEVFLDS